METEQEGSVELAAVRILVATFDPFDYLLMQQWVSYEQHTPWKA